MNLSKYIYFCDFTDQIVRDELKAVIRTQKHLIKIKQGDKAVLDAAKAVLDAAKTLLVYFT